MAKSGFYIHTCLIEKLEKTSFILFSGSALS